MLNVEGIEVHRPCSNLISLIRLLVPEAIQQETDMYFWDEVGQVVHETLTDDFAYRRGNGVEPCLSRVLPCGV